MPNKIIVEITGGMVSCIRMPAQLSDDTVECEIWDWDVINGQSDRTDEAIEALTKIVTENEFLPAPYEDCEFMGEKPSIREAWENWPEWATVEFQGERFPFTEVNGYRIGTDELNAILEDPLTLGNDIDDQFSYYVPFTVMMEGDRAVYDHIKAEIDDQIQGERP
jgi:hypothetical protein